MDTLIDPAKNIKHLQVKNFSAEMTEDPRAWE